MRDRSSVLVKRSASTPDFEKNGKSNPLCTSNNILTHTILHPLQPVKTVLDSIELPQPPPLHLQRPSWSSSCAFLHFFSPSALRSDWMAHPPRCPNKITHRMKTASWNKVKLLGNTDHGIRKRLVPLWMEFERSHFFGSGSPNSHFKTLKTVAMETKVCHGIKLWESFQKTKQ